MNSQPTDAMAGPLRNRRVLVTRAMDQAEPFVIALRSHGAAVVSVPLIATAPSHDPAATNAICGQATDLIISSANGVRYLGDALRALGAGAKVWAVGPHTAAALSHRGVTAQLLAAEFGGKALAEAVLAGGISGRRFVLAQAEVAQPDLAERLVNAGAQLSVVSLYRTFTPESAAADFREALGAGVDCVTFMSGSAVAAAVAAVGASAIAGTVVACIGPSTAATARELGVRVDLVAAVHTGSGLADALAEHWVTQPSSATNR